MIKAVIDNSLWSYLLCRKDQSLSHMFKAVAEKKLSLHMSKSVFNELLEILKVEMSHKHIDQKVVLKFIDILRESLIFHEKTPTIFSPLKGKNSKYIDLCLASDCECLVVYNYEDFKMVDGFRKINVIEFESFFSNLKY